VGLFCYFMWYQQQSEDYRPLFWISGRPIYANTLLVVFHIVAFVVCAIISSYTGGVALISALGLNVPEVWHGQVWRLASYIAFDPAFFQQRSLWFLWSILILYFCGREVEQFVGRRAYLTLYAALVLIPAVLLCLAGPLLGLLEFGPGGLPHLNCAEAIFGVFIAFATIYPGAMPSMWITIPVWVIAWIFFGLNSLLDFVAHDYPSIFLLWASSGVAYLGMRWVGAGRGLNWLTDWWETRRAEKLARRHQFKVLTERKSNESIDAILDKISRHGVNSLNASERAALERARTKLLDRDRR
jgi:membrane associated rhomboid family serine protease